MGVSCIDETVLEVTWSELKKKIRKQKSQISDEIEFDNGYFMAAEGYKYQVYEEARNILDFESWTEDMIGKHDIATRVLQALGRNDNLVYYMTNDFAEKIEKNVEMAERLLYDVYTAKDLEAERKAFENLTKYFGKNYDRTSYLFFLKDRERYLPIRPNFFKEKFQWLNIKTDCCDGCTWEHYLKFIEIMNEIRIKIEPYFEKVSLLDAHSFVWSIYLLNENYQNMESDFQDYSKGQVCLTVDEWKMVLEDREIFSDEYLKLLGGFYLARNHATTCSALAKEEGVHASHYNPYIVSMGKRITEKLNLPEMRWNSGERYYWPILFLGRGLIDGHFEWQMRPELVEAYGVVCQDALCDLRIEKEQRDAERMDDETLLLKAQAHSREQVITRKVYVEQKQRSACVSEFAKRWADGFCLLCDQKAPFNDKSGKPYLESHHIQWLSEGGNDSIDNVVALCPNCHKKMHILKGQPEELEDRKFLKDCVEEHLRRKNIAH